MQANIANNLLLSNMPIKDRHHFLASCEPVELVLGDVLNQLDDVIHHAYFPTTTIISLGLVIEDKLSLGVGIVGNEGMIGVPLLLGINKPLHSVGIHTAGGAFRISTSQFTKELSHSHSLQQYLNRYVYVVMAQLGQSAACNRYHVVEARLSRLLLMILNRSKSTTFYVTQEALAKLLGVRRVGVTKAAVALQHRNLISYSRGHFKVLDKAGLIAASCSCYQSDNAIYTQLMGSSA